jgi:hypothetical protein
MSDPQRKFETCIGYTNILHPYASSAGSFDLGFGNRKKSNSNLKNMKINFLLGADKDLGNS